MDLQTWPRQFCQTVCVCVCVCVSVYTIMINLNQTTFHGKEQGQQSARRGAKLFSVNYESDDTTKHSSVQVTRIHRDSATMGPQYRSTPKITTPLNLSKLGSGLGLHCQHTLGGILTRILVLSAERSFEPMNTHWRILRWLYWLYIVQRPQIRSECNRILSRCISTLFLHMDSREIW